MNSLKYVLERDGFLYGMNVPWFNHNSYGCDIGSNHRSDKCNFDPVQIEEVFYNCKAIGYNCVRIWLFEIMEGIRFDSNGFAVGFDSYFIRNLHTILDLAERIGVDLLVTFQPHISFSMSFPEEYNFYTRIIHNPEHTESFINNCIKTLAGIFELQDNVLMLDIYAEPEGDVTGIDGNMQPYGGSWEQMQTYLSSICSTFKIYAPSKPVTIASGWRKYDSLREGRYNDIGLDYIGVDIYNDTGEVEPAGDLGTKGVPVWLAEFGPELKDEWNEEFYTGNTVSFYENARKNGYFGAFHWMYGYAQSGESLTMIGKDGKLRPVADFVRALILENKMKYSGGISHFVSPALLFIRSPGEIAWFPSDKAKEYILERTEDLINWEKVENISPDNTHPKERICTADERTEIGKNYYYRVKAVFENGEELYSKISNRITF
jgi:hypothetical protein